MQLQPYRVAETYDPLILPLVPYPDIAAHIAGRLRSGLPELRTILDVACGTGNLTIPLARLGFHVAGLDVSPKMLAIARRKAAADGQRIEFVCQDMRQDYRGAPVDAVTCFGAVHFLDGHEALKQALTTMYRALKPGGMLAFDLFAADKMRSLFSGTRSADHGSFYAVTKSRCDNAGRITHDVTFFLRDNDNRYRREDERHHLRVHNLSTARRILTDVGFAPPAVEPIHPAVNAEYLRDVSLIIARKRLGAC